MSVVFPSFDRFLAKQETVAVVGLGYVGLPLAVALSRCFSVLGFDISRPRVEELRQGRDRTGEVADFSSAGDIRFSSEPLDLAAATLLIVAVPTPLDAHRNPDLGPIEAASVTVGRVLARGSVVVYESTVYPGVTEEVCVPILERESGFCLAGGDFAVGYSPERINPGDKVHTVERIVKVVSASSPTALELLAEVYGSVVKAGVHRAPSIKVAEAAKVIENTQRDLNIALMNELALIFDKLGIDTLDVLEAAGTKWNFLPFRPGLVGGHCIGVDPYYLTYRAEAAGYHPEVILAGRRINDGMGKYIAEKTVKMLIASGRRVDDARVGILGFTFKENVPDLRNTRVVDIKRELDEYGVTVLIHDPVADPDEARIEYGIELLPWSAMSNLDAVVLAVAHEAFVALNVKTLQGCFASAKAPVVLDIKGIMKHEGTADLRYWRL